jgi:hypothetical protein
MKKILITLVLASFLFSLPVLGEGREAITSDETQLPTSVQSGLPALLQSISVGVGIKRRRRRRVRRYYRRRVRRHYRRRVRARGLPRRAVVRYKGRTYVVTRKGRRVYVRPRR